MSDFNQYRRKLLVWYYGNVNLAMKRNEQVHVYDS